MRSARRAPPTTRAPSRASTYAVAAPMPLDAPVTIAIFPSSAATGGTLTAHHRQFTAQEAGRRVLDLQRRMREAELRCEEPLQPSPGGVAVRAVSDEHVRRNCRKAARDRPHVQIMDADD